MKQLKLLVLLVGLAGLSHPLDLGKRFSAGLLAIAVLLVRCASQRMRHQCCMNGLGLLFIKTQLMHSLGIIVQSLVPRRWWRTARFVRKIILIGLLLLL